MGKDDWVENMVVAMDEYGDPHSSLRLYEYKERFHDIEDSGDAIVKVEASTVSMMDCFIRRNVWHQTVSTPYRLGCDFVGRVVHTKANKNGIEIGDRVCAIGLKVGGNSKYTTVPCSSLIKCPTGMDGPTVACLLRTYMVAYQCLHRAGSFAIREGDKVLVTGGSGAVGQAVIQLAKVARAGEIYATGRGSKSQRIITALGAKFLDRKPQDWLPKVRGKMDIVIDSTCYDSFDSSRLALKDGRSKLVCIGTTSKLREGNGYFTGLPLLTHLDIFKAKMFMSKTTFFDLLTSFDENPEGYKDDLGRLFKLLKSDAIMPKIAFCVPLEKIAYAHRTIENGDVCGTIVCQPFDFERTQRKNRKEIREDCSGKDELTTYTDGIIGKKAKDDKSLFSGYTTEMTDYSGELRQGPGDDPDLESDFNKHHYSVANAKRKIKLLDDDETLNKSQKDFDKTDSMTFKSDIKFSDKTIADSIDLRKQQCFEPVPEAVTEPYLPPEIFGTNQPETQPTFIIKKKEKSKSKSKGIFSLLPKSPASENRKKADSSHKMTLKVLPKKDHADNSDGSLTKISLSSGMKSTASYKSKYSKSAMVPYQKELSSKISISKTRSSSRNAPSAFRTRSLSRTRTNDRHSEDSLPTRISKDDFSRNLKTRSGLSRNRSETKMQLPRTRSGSRSRRSRS